MATLILGAIGNLVGGPFGHAIGALVGSQLDRKIIGTPSREGPRLKELAVSTSSYGGPIPFHIGQVRSAGTIFWATDFQESSETSGSKGGPKVTSYSYSVSFAVLLSANPIDRVGRIWADGNLLRGEAGDLKTGGALRTYAGHADQEPDALLEAALEEQCPANRGCAYAVFEDLQIADFGNRIPALTFEIFAGSGSRVVSSLAIHANGAGAVDTEIEEIAGFSYEGGPVWDAISVVSEAGSILPDASRSPVILKSQPPLADAQTLSDSLAWEEGDFGARDGVRNNRRVEPGGYFNGLRYYDIDRDYQPGVQRLARRADNASTTLTELPASLDSAGARRIADRIARRGDARRETRFFRSASLIPTIQPGAVVRLPDTPGYFEVVAWEWREGGVELELTRRFDRDASAAPATPGLPWLPADALPGAFFFEAFELPWDGVSSDPRGSIVAAVGTDGGRWGGAAIYAERSGSLVPLSDSGTRPAIMGQTLHDLDPSPGIMFEPRAVLDIQLHDHDAVLSSTDKDGLASGENRILVGNEILQFAHAEALGNGAWRLVGLLRGRGGTEGIALAGTAAGASCVHIDDRLITLDRGTLADSASLSVISSVDPETLSTDIVRRGEGERPLSPVHARSTFGPDGALELCWTRRARGAWRWLAGVTVPLIEETERYEVGCGPVSSPFARWEVEAATLTISASTHASLAANHPGADIWVRQIGNYGVSPALFLASL